MAETKKHEAGIHVRLDPPLRDALSRFRFSQAVVPSEPAAIRQALREWLPAADRLADQVAHV